MEKHSRYDTLIHSFLILVSFIETRIRRRLGILFPDWMEISQKGARLWHVPSPSLEEENGSIWPHRLFCHLQTGGRISESWLVACNNIMYMFQKQLAWKPEFLHAARVISSHYSLACACSCVKLANNSGSLFYFCFLWFRFCLNVTVLDVHFWTSSYVLLTGSWCWWKGQQNGCSQAIWCQHTHYFLPLYP